MHRKWHGLFQVLAGAGTAALVWSLLRHKSRKARRRVVRRRSETDHAAICEAQGEKQGRSGAQVGVRETGSVQTSQGQEQQQEQQSGSSTPERTPSEDRDVLDEDPEDGPLYQVTENALIVHQMLLQGDEEIQFRDFSALPVNGEPGGQHPAVDLANKVKAAAESAFFDQLGQGLSEQPPQMERLVSLVLDSRDQLAALVPASTPEGQALMAGIKEKLDTEYVSQRISQGYDPAYLSQLFDFLVHLITRLQAPARRASTEAKYKAVQQQFAEAAAEAEAAAAAVARAAAAAAAAAAVREQQPAGDVPGSAAPLAGGSAGGSAGGAPAALRPGPGLAAATPASSRSSSFRERNSREWVPGAAGAAGSAAGTAGSSFSGEDYRTVVLRPTASPEAKEKEAEAEDSVTVQFVVREEVQSVRLIMRVVQKHWLERHGSMGAAAATPTPRPTPTGSLFGGSASNSRSSSPRPTSRGAGPASGGAAAAAAALQRPSPMAVSSSASASAAPAEAAGAAASPAALAPAAAATGSAAGRLARPLTVQVPGGSAAAVAEQAEQQAQQAQRPRSLAPGEVKALVAAAWLMWDQLRELKADVAKARLSLLKGAITHGGSGVQYERTRYLKAIGDTPPTLAMPKTLAWLRDAVLLGHPNPLLQGEELVRACVCTGILQLLQRPLAVSSADCPETLLLDCRTLVDLQNELQRVCLLVAACLIARQVLAGRQVRLPEEEQRELREAIKRRIGVLLSAGVNLEGITVELNHQIQEALAAVSLPTSPDVSPDRARLQQQQLAAAAAAAAVLGGEAAEGGAGGGSRRSVGSSAASAGDSDVEGIEVVARMVQRIFSTHDPVYQRVQAGIVSALTALLVGAQGLEGCRRVLRGIGGEIVLDEVLQLGAGVDKIGSLSAIVCLPFYEDMLKQIERERQAGAQSAAGTAGTAGSGSYCGSAHGQGQGTGTAPSVASSVGEGGGDGLGL